MKQTIEIFNADLSLEKQQRLIQEQLVGKIAAQPFLVQFVVEQMKFLEISRLRALDSGEDISREKAQGIRESVQWLLHLLERAHLPEDNEMEKEND